MKNRAKNIAIAAVIASMATTSANAFDIKLIYSMNPGVSWTETNGNSVSQYGVYDTNNIGIEIGHYKNSNKEGFGFGWHLGMSTPVNDEFWNAGTVFELGFAPGYSITEELAIKLELAFQFKNGWDKTASNSGEYSQANIAGFAYGLSAEYVFGAHYVVGGAVKNYNYAKNEFADPVLVPELSIAYRF